LDFLGFAPAAGVPSEGVPAPLPFWDPWILPPSRGACTAGESTCMPSSTSPSSKSPSSRAVGHPQSASVREGQEAGRRARAWGRFAWLPDLSIRPCHRRRPSSHHPSSQRPLESFPTPPSGFSAWTPSPVAAAPPPTRSSCLHSLSASPLGSPPRRRRGEADSPGEQETAPLRTELTRFCRRSHRQERPPASSTPRRSRGSSTLSQASQESRPFLDKLNQSDGNSRTQESFRRCKEGARRGKILQPWAALHPRHGSCGSAGRRSSCQRGVR